MKGTPYVHKDIWTEPCIHLPCTIHEGFYHNNT